MAEISVSNLTFCYEGSSDNIFEHVSFSIDTNWKLGFIGRNGKGKTTFLKLLQGKYEYQGTIDTKMVFDYFPYSITEKQMKLCFADLLEEIRPDYELWRVICELEKLHLETELLYRPFLTLSHGERTKMMLAVLFSGEHYFLLIDEPTNHLEQESREVVKQYLKQKKGFILVSHDRELLDACVDHVLVLNRYSIEVQNGNFSSWWLNKERKDIFNQKENEKHQKEIRQLKKAADRAERWAEKNEGTKIGFDPVKEHDRGNGTRPYIGAKTKKMQSRVTQMQKRINREIEQKEGLLQDIEKVVDLKMMPQKHYKKILILAKEYGILYKNKKEDNKVLQDFNFELSQGERVFLQGRNGCGKSSFIKAVLAHIMQTEEKQCKEKQFLAGDRILYEETTLQGIEKKSEGIVIKESGTLETAKGLMISYVNQETSFLCGSLTEFCKKQTLEESLLKAILRQLDFGREQFAKNMEEYSEGQKKKVLLAASLATKAHLYLWDEPLNYIDVFSRMQIEQLILRYQPTMLIVEHDRRFQETIATQVVNLS